MLWINWPLRNCRKSSCGSRDLSRPHSSERIQHSVWELLRLKATTPPFFTCTSAFLFPPNRKSLPGADSNLFFIPIQSSNCTASPRGRVTHAKHVDLNRLDTSSWTRDRDKQTEYRQSAGYIQSTDVLYGISSKRTDYTVIEMLLHSKGYAYNYWKIIWVENNTSVSSEWIMWVVLHTDNQQSPRAWSPRNAPTGWFPPAPLTPHTPLPPEWKPVGLRSYNTGTYHT